MIWIELVTVVVVVVVIDEREMEGLQWIGEGLRRPGIRITVQ